jgi:hypothetical protein
MSSCAIEPSQTLDIPQSLIAKLENELQPLAAGDGAHHTHKGLVDKDEKGSQDRSNWPEKGSLGENVKGRLHCHLDDRGGGRR